METANTNTQQPQQQETKWYVLRVVSGKERKVKEYLDKEVSRGEWGHGPEIWHQRRIYT